MDGNFNLNSFKYYKDVVILKGNILDSILNINPIKPYGTHGYTEAIMDKKDFNNVIREEGAYHIKPIEIEGTDRVRVVISGFPDKGIIPTVLGLSQLGVAFNDERDMAYDRAGLYHSTVIDERDEVAINALRLAIQYDKNTQQGMKVNYALVPVLYNGYQINTYFNSNSFATSLALYSGARYWNVDHDGVGPGNETIMYKKYFYPIKR